MSYPKDREIEYSEREVLFLVLALQTNASIIKKMNCCRSKLWLHHRKLMLLFCGNGTTDLLQIYYVAKNDEKLCNDLADEFKWRYPLLVAEVLRRPAIRYERINEDGEKKWYIFKV